MTLNIENNNVHDFYMMKKNFDQYLITKGLGTFLKITIKEERKDAGFKLNGP